jgi:hypothetical protein
LRGIESVLEPTMQTKKQSWVESTVNVAIGLTINLTLQVLVFPLFGVHIPFTSNLWIAAVFTAVSVLRNYCIRRWFNASRH